MRKILRKSVTCALLAVFAVLFAYPAFGIAIGDAKPAEASDERAPVQIDPEPEQLDQVSETDDQASEEIGADSETDDQASEEVGADSETAGQASEILPPAPGGEEYPLENQAPVEEQMPLGDREAEGKGLGE